MQCHFAALLILKILNSISFKSWMEMPKETHSRMIRVLKDLYLVVSCYCFVVSGLVTSNLLHLDDGRESSIWLFQNLALQ